MTSRLPRHWRQWLLAAILLSLLSALFVNSRVDLDAYRRVNGLLAEMRDRVTIINQQLIELEAATVRNYDQLSAAEVAIRDQLRYLKEQQLLTPLLGAEGERQLQDLQAVWRQKFRAIEGFKARNALHKNLIFYAPRNIEDLLEQVRRHPDIDPAEQRETESLLYRLGSHLFVNHGHRLIDELGLSEQLLETQEQLTVLLPEDLQQAATRLFDRLRLALLIEGQLVSDLGEAADIALDDRILATQAKLRTHLAAAIEEAREYRIGLYLFGLLLLLYLARMFLRLQQLSRHLESSLSELEFQKRALDEHSIVTITDAAGNIVYANDRMCEISGYGRDELLGQNHRMLKSGLHDIDFYRELWNSLTKTGKWQGEIVNRARNGRLYWVATTLLARYDESGKPKQYIGIRTDITAQKLAEQEARLLARFPSEDPDPVLRLDDAGSILYANPASQVLLDHWGVLAGERMLPEWTQILQASLDRNQVESHDIHIGDEHYELRFVPVVSEGYVNLYARNITEIKRAEAHLNYQARHDPLTGLYNRYAFEKFLDETLLRAQSSDEGSLLMYIDLDQFKVVNDTGGHVAGDELLRQISEVLRLCIRDSDVLARLGGDEFGIILNGCDLAHGSELAGKLLQAVNEYRFLWEGASFKVGASIGIALIDENSDSAVRLLGEADIACYAAKDKGRNRYEVYRSGAGLEQRRNEMQWAAVLPEALAQNRFELFAQRIKPLMAETDEPEHYELLLRLRDDEGGLIPPGAFLPAAERYGLMSSIDLWIVERAFERLERAGQPLSLSINLSGNSLGDDRFLDYLLDRLARHRLDPKRLTFEITETSAIANLNLAVELITRLRECGCRFALDDFGSGLSSFAYLKNLPVDYLKIDGAFVRDIVDDPIDEAMVQAINHIGHVMGIQTIAEFVESPKIEQRLRRLRVDFVQGYGVHRPEPLEQVLERLTAVV